MIGFGQGSRSVEWEQRRIAPVYGNQGMVASAHPLVTTTGLEVLQHGGNAVDAAIAAAVTAAVVMPEMCGLGGDLFAIVHEPNSGETLSFLGSGISPRGSSIEEMHLAGMKGNMPFRGPLAVGVPGMVDAYFSMLNRFGTRSFSEVAERGTVYAEHGHPLSMACAGYITEYRELLSSFESSAAVFLAGGASPKAGDLLKQVDLGRTLRSIAQHGPDIFYRGDIGRQIISAMQANGGSMSLDDFADHETDVVAPISTTYRGHTIYQTGLPSQGMIMLEHLNVIEASGVTPADADAAWLHLLVEAKKIAYADRMSYAGDAAFGSTPMTTLLSKEWAKSRATSIDPDRAATDVPAGPHADGDTTYLCVIDANGMMVSLIQSVSAAFGCGMVAGETGVVLNNRVGRGFSLEDGHPNIFEPGKKTMHTLNCFLIANPEGIPVLVGGTPGGDGQPQWNTQMITGMLDYDLDVQATIDAPRWTSWPGTDPSTLPNSFELRMEDRIGPEIIAGLEKLGHTVVQQQAWDGGGAGQIIARDPTTGLIAGGTDPRVEGLVAGF